MLNYNIRIKLFRQKNMAESAVKMDVWYFKFRHDRVEMSRTHCRSWGCLSSQAGHITRKQKLKRRK